MTPFAALIACAVAVADWGPIRLDSDSVPLPPGVIARIGSTRFRHEGTCNRVHFPPDGRHILGVTDDTLYTWDAHTGITFAVTDLGGIVTESVLRADGALVFVTRSGRGAEAFLRVRPLAAGPTKTVLTFDDDGSCCLSPDGTRLAVRTAGLVRLFDTVDAKLLGDIRLSISDYDPHTLAVSPDNRNVLAAYRHWTEVREFATGNVVYAESVAGTDDEIHEAVFTPDGREVLCAVDGEKKNRLEVIDLKSGKVHRLHESTDRMRKIVVPPDGRTVYAARGPETIQIERTKGSVATFGSALTGSVRPFFSPDGRQLAMAGSTHQVTFWNPQSRQRVASAEDLEAAGHTLEFNRDGHRLILNDLDSPGVVQLVEVSQRRILRTIRFGRTEDVCLVPNGIEYAVATARHLRIRDATSDAVTFEANLNFPATPVVETIVGGRLALARGDERVDVWDRTANKRLASFPVERHRGFLPLPDGLSALSWELRKFGHEYLWDFRRTGLIDRQPYPDEKGFQAYGGRLKFDPMGRFALFQRTRSRAGLFDIKAARVRPYSLPFSSYDLSRCSFTTDGRCLAGWQRDHTALQSGISIIETSSGKLRCILPLHGELLASAFSPDGRMLAALSPTAPLYLFDYRGTLLNLPKSLDRTSLDAHWSQLLGDDGEASFRALRSLAAAPDSTIPFVRGKIAAAKGPMKPELDALVQSLEAPAFRDREAASKELTRIASVVEGELRAAEKGTESPEVRQRLEKVLRATLPESPESVRRTRIVEVVEWCGTAAAKQLLKEWAAGATGADLTKQAKLALARLGG